MCKCIQLRALSILILYTEKQINKSWKPGFLRTEGRGTSLEKYINWNPWTLNVKLKPSAFSAAMPMLLQATAVCAIAWQQALPEALVSSQVETQTAPLSTALISVWLFGIGNTRRKMNLDKHQTLKHKSELIIEQLSPGSEHVMEVRAQERGLKSQKNKQTNQRKYPLLCTLLFFWPRWQMFNQECERAFIKS